MHALDRKTIGAGCQSQAGPELVPPGLATVVSLLLLFAFTQTLTNPLHQNEFVSVSPVGPDKFTAERPLRSGLYPKRPALPKSLDVDPN